AEADRAWVLDVYAAGETPQEGISGRTVVDRAAEAGARHVEFAGDPAAAAAEAARQARPGDIVLTLGAGDVWKLADRVLEALGGGHESPCRRPSLPRERARDPGRRPRDRTAALPSPPRSRPAGAAARAAHRRGRARAPVAARHRDPPAGADAGAAGRAWRAVGDRFGRRSAASTPGLSRGGR